MFFRHFTQYPVPSDHRARHSEKNSDEFLYGALYSKDRIDDDLTDEKRAIF